MPNNQSTKKKLITTNSTLCLSLYLSYLYKLVTNIEWQSHKAKKPNKKKKKNPQAAAAQTSTIHHNSQHKHRKLKHENWNTTSPQVRTTQAQFLLSMNLRFLNHKVINILLGFEGKDKSKYLWTVKAEAKNLGWADRATGGSNGKWVSSTVATSSHRLTAVARSRWESKLHGVTDSRRHSLGMGGGVGVGECTEWVSLTISLSVSPLYSLSHLSILFFFFLFLPWFFCSLRNSVWCWVFCFFCFFFNRLLGSWAPRLGGSWVLDWPDDGLGGQGGFMIFWEGARAKN